MSGDEDHGAAAESSAAVAWEEAWARASVLLSGVTRRRLAASEPGVELALLDWGGPGELAVLHHANGFCAASLAPIAYALRDRYRIVSVDARGHGDSTAVSPAGEPDPYRWTRLAADLNAVIAQLLPLVGCEHVALAIGHSFGGALLLAAAGEIPGRFERLLLCDPVIPPRGTVEERTRANRSNPLAVATRRRRDRFPSREAAYEHCRPRGLFADFTPEALALYVGEGMRETPEGEIALKCDREVEASIFEGSGMIDFFARAGSISAEVLFLHAGRGNFSVEAYEALAAEMPKAWVEPLDAGHLFPLEEPERVLAAVDALAGTMRD